MKFLIKRVKRAKVENGLRFDFTNAMGAEEAKIVYNKLVDKMKKVYSDVGSG